MRPCRLVALLLLATAPALADDAAQPVDALGRARAAEALGAELFAALATEPDPAALARATRAFADAGAQPCEGGVARVVVLAPRSDGTQPAYLLSQPASGQGVFGGGHFRLDLAQDGSAGPLARFGKCKLLAWDADEEENMQAAYLARPGADSPSEIDVLISRELPFALGVVTGGKVWPLIGGSISEPLEADPEMGAEE